jgi:PKD repeat protein
MYVTGANNVFAYADSYTIIFSVKDDQGVTTTQNWPLKVQKSDLPIISDVSPTKVVLNQNTAWTVTAYDPDGEAISYQADWGDGSPVSDKQFYSVFTHTYTKVGTYTAIFTVYDEEGPDKGLKTSKSVAIVVLPPCTYDLSLVLLYGFDEGAGTKVYDLSCSTSNDGLISYIYGAPANAVTWVAQDEGRTALKFIGGGWVKTPDANTLDVSSGFTIDAWVKINQFKHLYSTIVKKDGAYGLRFAGSPTVKLHGWFISSSDGSLVEIYSHKTDWITDRWYRLTFTYDGTTMKLYIDGALDGSQPYSGSAVNSNGEIRLGWGTSAEWLVGLINELRIYSRALSGSEIGAPSNSPPGIEGVSGPSSIGIYHQGTWTVDAYDPEYKPLQYQVNWGDGSGDSPKQSSPTFAHIYPTTGTYTIAFTVYDDQGLTASKTTTVNAITLAGPVLWYKFDEGSGTTAQDSSGNGFHGSIKGSVKYVDGKIGKALSYNGTSGSYVTRSDSNALHSAGLTVMAWIKPATDPNSWSGFHVILTKADQYLFRFSGDDLYGNTYRDLYGGVASGGSVFIQGESFDWQPNEWYHVAFTYEGTVLKLYVNGVEKASQEYHLPIYYSNIPVFVGSNFAGYDGIFNGVIDDVRIYNRALPQGEIQFLIS